MASLPVGLKIASLNSSMLHFIDTPIVSYSNTVQRVSDSSDSTTVFQFLGIFIDILPSALTAF